MRIELPGDVAEAVLREHGTADGLEVDYAVNVWWRRY